MEIVKGTVFTNPKDIDDKWKVIWTFQTEFRLEKSNFAREELRDKRFYQYPDKIPAWLRNQIQLKAQVEGKIYK